MRTTTMEIRDGIAWLTIDDGKVNALGEGLLREIEARLEQARGEARVTVLRGRPGIFSAGFDMATFQRGAEPTREMLLAGTAVIEKILTQPQPVITGCTGHAFPMGAFLMMSADLRYGVPGPFRIGMNEVAIGITVPRFALELARHRLTAVGFARIPTGRMFTPEEATRLGYLDEIVPATNLDEHLARAAAEMRSLDETAFARTKARVNETLLATIRSVSRPDVLAEDLRSQRDG